PHGGRDPSPTRRSSDLAKAAGYASLPAPPTFIFAVELDADTVLAALKHMGVNLGRILHGEQQFTYFAPVCAGDTITVESKFTDIDRKSTRLNSSHQIIS